MDIRVLYLGGNFFNDISHNYFDTIKSFIQTSASDMIHTENHAVQKSGLIFLTNAASILDLTKGKFIDCFFIHNTNIYIFF